jgi:hypothetical protein
MRKTILGLAAAFAVTAAGSASALACDSCSPCGYVSPCAPAYVQPYGGCVTGCGAAYERLPDPVVQYHSAPIAQPQYYYVEQGPTYSGPGDFAPRRYYQEQGVSGWGYHHHRRHYGYGYGYHHYPWHHHRWHRYGYGHVLHSYY